MATQKEYSSSLTSPCGGLSGPGEDALATGAMGATGIAGEFIGEQGCGATSLSEQQLGQVTAGTAGTSGPTGPGGVAGPQRPGQPK